MLLLLLYVAPILATGTLILRKLSLIKRTELLFPAGAILGLTIFTFLLNLVAFFIKGNIGIITAFLLTLLLGVILKKKVKSEDDKIDLPEGKALLLWLLSIVAWGGFIYWKSAHALIGSDTNLYYAISHSFIKGNFPLLTPWQPDIPLSYHVGASELLGSFYFFSGLNFQFLHLFFSALFIFCMIQIVIWLLKRHNYLIDFLFGNLIAAVVFISFGFIYITWPILPFQLPAINNINQLVLWLRDLPTVNQAIEVYGAPINLDALIYFIFHNFGLAIFFLLMVLLINLKKEKPLAGWIIILISLSVLALVNESLFLAAFPAILFGILLIELKNKTLRKNLGKLFLLLAITLLLIFFQGGMISAAINTTVVLEKSAVIFPKRTDIKEDFISYHYGQSVSKLLPQNMKQTPFRWFHVGIDFLLALSLIAVVVIKSPLESVLIRFLFIAGLISLIAYNTIVPKFLVANGNRFLSASFLFFSLLLCLSLRIIFKNVLKSRLKKIAFLVIIGWIFIPTILPPLALLSKTRFGENKLIPKKQESSEGILWLKDNIKFSERAVILDRNAPHPSGQARALVEAGIFAPVFAGDIRAFTIEASPEYIDIAYSLSPEALKKLQVSILLIDAKFFENLPYKRRQQLEEDRFFEKIFDNSKFDQNWEKVYRIKGEYLISGGEMGGTLKQSIKLFTNGGKIYIDNEENFNPSYLRRSLIFILRNNEIYYLPQSGVYLNVEANINSHTPRKEKDYDYLVLGKNSNPREKCNCAAKLIWKGLKDEVYVWQRI